ncbi:MAG: hypothetical protein HQ465_21220 [Rhodospirillales bacterium]|nr:hypothetical protein [Rhodospirillales bacterium]
MNMLDLGPLDYLWAVVGNLGSAPWVFKAVCAWVALVCVFLLPREPEHWPLVVGLFMVGVSPMLPPAGPFGDWLVYPASAALLLRRYLKMRPTLKAIEQIRGPSPERVLAEAAKRVLIGRK